MHTGRARGRCRHQGALSRSVERMPSDPSNVVGIVTGGVRGLGRAMTLALMRSGARVAVCDLPASAREASELVSVAENEGLQDSLLCLQCDVTQWRQCVDSVSKIIERFGALHGLVNNAGVGMQDIGNVL